MVNLAGELGAANRLVLAIDTSDGTRARQLAEIASDAGALLIKEGLELMTAPELGPEFCSRNAEETGLDWVADAKLADIPTTTARAVANIAKLPHPPVAITIQTSSGVESMRAAQETAGEHGIVMLGVTELTTVTEEELRAVYETMFAAVGVHKVPEGISLRKLVVHARALNAARAGVKGLVASSQELRDPLGTDPKLSTMLTMIPGTRSTGEATHDQQNVGTPYQALVDGATLLVIGRQVTASENPSLAFSLLVDETNAGLQARSQSKG